MTVCILLCSIQALLSAPNPDDPLAENVAKHWKENEQEAVATGDACPLSMYTMGCSVYLYNHDNLKSIPVLAILTQICMVTLCVASVDCKCLHIIYAG